MKKILRRLEVIARPFHSSPLSSHRGIPQEGSDTVSGADDARERKLRAENAARKMREGDLKKKLADVSEKSAKRSAGYAVMRPAYRAVQLADACVAAASDLAADVFVAHEVRPLGAVDALAAIHGGRRICDAVESPSYTGRAAPRTWNPNVVALMDAASRGFLSSCDAITTVGSTLGSELRRYGPPVYVIENYRYAGDLAPSDRLRRQCGLGETDRLVVSAGMIASEFENVLQAFKVLPHNLHLAAVGTFLPDSYRQTIETVVDELDLGGRVHVFPPVPYRELTSTLSSAACGLIIRNPAIRNNYVSLPNRVFDYLGSGVPIVSPRIPDIEKIITENGCGVVLAGTTPQDWADGISRLLEREEEAKANALRAGAALTWESREPLLLRIFEGAKRVTFVGMTDLWWNNRTRRMALSLAKAGTVVNVCSFERTSPPPGDHPNIRFVSLGARP